ncbi:MAG: hypothetical protein KC503_26390 [Myxococcales bacterium]|nr:hypothetical protein [Myxococcales bacterium]
MKLTTSILAIASLSLFVACGGMPETEMGQRSSNLFSEKDKPLPKMTGLFPDTVVRPEAIPGYGVTPSKPEVSNVQLTKRFAAICNNGSMVISPRVDAATFTLSFDLGLIGIGNQRVLDFGTVAIDIVNNYLRLIENGQPVARYRLWAPPNGMHVEVAVQPYRVEFYIDGELVGARRRESALFHAVRMRFGGNDEGDKSPGMCGAIDNVLVRDEAKALINGRTAESNNSLLLGFTFDGASTNMGRGRYVFQFEGDAGLISNY